jgi:hypothetical protein
MTELILKFYVASLIKFKNNILKRNMDIEEELLKGYNFLARLYIISFMLCLMSISGWIIEHVVVDREPKNLVIFITFMTLAIIILIFTSLYQRKIQKTGICQDLYKKMLSYSKEDINKHFRRGCCLVVASFIVSFAFFTLFLLHVSGKI